MVPAPGQDANPLSSTRSAELVERLAELVKSKAEWHVFALPRSRCPILKVTGEEVQCDLAFENRLALENTRLVRSYALLDSRIRPLILFCTFSFLPLLKQNAKS